MRPLSTTPLEVIFLVTMSCQSSPLRYLEEPLVLRA